MPGTESSTQQQLSLIHIYEGVHVAIRVAHLLADLIEAIDLGDHVAKCHAHVLDDGLVVIERRLLLQDAHGVAGGEPGICLLYTSRCV